MSIFGGITHWFQKRESVIGVAQATLEKMTRFNALVRSDPKDIIDAIDNFNMGYLAPLARLIAEYEERDDKMRVSSIKMASAVSRCGWSVRPKKGFEDDEAAAKQVEILERFWSTINVTSAFKRNERGGINLLKEQMMAAQSYGFSCHDLSWRPLPNGELEATFTHVPLWHFENRTGELRYVPDVAGWDGVPMKPGEWMVSTGDGVGIAAAIVACMKRLGLTNWLVFTDRCVLPLLHAKTGAAFGSDQWKNLESALRNINRLAKLQTDPSTEISAIQMDGGKQNPFGPLIEWADRAIVTLYRGGDLATISRPDAVGANPQLDETDALEQRSCGRITETLNEQVCKFVIDYVCNEPLRAEIVVEPVSKPDVKQDMEIDKHLIELGVKLSKTDALSRYGRAEAETDDDALQAPKNGEMGGLGAPRAALPNETPLQTRKNGLQNAPRLADGQGEGSTPPPSQIAENRPSVQSAVIEAFIKQNSPAAEAIKAVLKNPSAGAFAQLMVNLPGLIPQDPALAAVIADEMARVYSAESKPELANECQSDDPAHCRVHGTPEYKAASPEAVSKFLKELPSDISPDEFDALTTAGFSDTDGAGNSVKYGTLLRDHINKDSRNEEDRDARKKKLGMAVRMVRNAKPLPSKDAAKPAERVYSGIVDGNAYIAVADEHGEMDAMLMVSYRRGKRKEVRNA